MIKRNTKQHEMSAETALIADSIVGRRGMTSVGKAVICLDDSLIENYKKSSRDEQCEALAAILGVANQAFQDNSMGVKLTIDPVL